jgi:hypothetical protein
MADGRTLAMYFMPLQLSEENKGGIWKFREITNQRTVERQLADLRYFYENILNYIALPERFFFFIPNQVAVFLICYWQLNLNVTPYYTFVALESCTIVFEISANTPS